MPVYHVWSRGLTGYHVWSRRLTGYHVWSRRITGFQFFHEYNIVPMYCIYILHTSQFLGSFIVWLLNLQILSNVMYTVRVAQTSLCLNCLYLFLVIYIFNVFL